MQSRRCCDRYAQDETANLTYMCSYGYTCPTHQISSLETKYSARISAGGEIGFWSTRCKCGHNNAANAKFLRQTYMHLRDTYAGTFSVGPRPGHANYPPVTRIDHISKLAAMGIWLHRACSVWRPGGPSHMVNLVKSRSTFKRLGSDTCLYCEQSSHYHSFWGNLIRGQKTYKAKNSARVALSSPCPRVGTRKPGYWA